jgi:hypothetical protein
MRIAIAGNRNPKALLVVSGLEALLSPQLDWKTSLAGNMLPAVNPVRFKARDMAC